MYIIKKTGNNINCINDAAWDSANVANIDKVNWQEYGCVPKTTGKLLYNDYGIYVQLETDEKPLFAGPVCFCGYGRTDLYIHRLSG